MRILDKTVSKAPWERFTSEQRDRLTQSGQVFPWMFQHAVVLTVVNDGGDRVHQLDGTVMRSEITPEIKLTLGKRVRELFTKNKLREKP